MENLFRFFYKNSFVLVFLLLQGLSLWLIANYTYHQQSVLYKISSGVSGSFFEKKTTFTDYLNLDLANSELVEENTILKNKSVDSYFIINKEYSILNDTLYKKKYTHFAAKVINSTFNKVENYLTLNKGSNGGIKPNMAVISSKGLVGLTTTVSDNYSIVLPIINLRANHSVQIKGKYYFGILKWDGSDFRIINMEEVANHAIIQVGDTIETRESALFPEGIPVGVIKSTETVEGSNFLRITVGLFVDFSKIYYVDVIENLMKEEQLNIELEGLK